VSTADTTATTPTDTALPGDPQGADRRVRRIRLPLTLAVVVGLGVLVAIDVPSLSATVVAAADRAADASAGWLLLAMALTVSSMVAFGALRRRTIVAAGGRLSRRESVALSYAAGAIHMTAPGGGVLSTAYAFRRLQRAGIPPAAITWSLAISGVISTVTLVALGATGFAVDGSTGSWVQLIPAGALAVVIGAALTAVFRHPDRLAGVAARLLRVANRCLRRPPDTGALTLQATIEDLRAIRARPRDWMVASSAAIANWLLDLLCLWACAHALGLHVPPWALLASYSLAMAGAGLSPLPGGVGLVDGILVLALTSAAGAGTGVAVGVVLLYRVVSFGTLLAGGWSAVGLQTLRARRGSREFEIQPADRGGREQAMAAEPVGVA
jgi:uncharacterized protein (TIRG00374 family)